MHCLVQGFSAEMNEAKVRESKGEVAFRKRPNPKPGQAIQMNQPDRFLEIHRRKPDMKELSGRRNLENISEAKKISQ